MLDVEGKNHSIFVPFQSTDSEDNLVQGRKASLSDLRSIGDINALSVRQLKEILARNFVNYKGCCEKWELLERVTRLYKEKDLQHLGKKLGEHVPVFQVFLFYRREIELTLLFCFMQVRRNEGVLCRLKYYTLFTATHTCLRGERYGSSGVTSL